MARSDLPAVLAVAEIVHPLYPESPAVAIERLALYPAGCLVAERGGGLLGYAVSHPGVLGRPPALDVLLGTLPGEADCLYLHDIALLPEAHGKGHGKALVARLAALARKEGFARLALTAVNNSAGYWARHGFQPYAGDAALAAKLASYGEDALYLVRPVD
ncbi:MAG: GNAT family N-acetyltransferase [Alphaproteobacteria bacterium]|nr:GNAT family N-acetyltransferase [Alphaproteobacteria bacterium]MBU0796145.1 GNAT family N-acetyltransferase [Alphaproteobacteria bacterium]MBU0888516.1 GNAT family N-acetyltransferase [Alphaproteobacteria bacterium]MBU1813021.1 GNAT family N-acetyltransferase [Alphaproteobacteria bacterium]MBU2089816.1 GNAT family N-acetyltransferase [Alphaproteobacteria bacterium]